MKFDILDLIYRVPNFLSDDECDSLVAEYEERKSESSYEHCIHANTGEDTYSSFHRIELNQNTDSYNLIFKKTEKAINEYIKHLDSFNCFHIPCLRQVFRYSHTYRLLKYEQGCKIHPHSDHAPFAYGSITFNLNNDYTGGVFKFFNGEHEVHLSKGEMMIWPADFFWVHEVTPIETGVRYSTNSFLTSIPEYMREIVDVNVREMFCHHQTPQPYQIS